MKDATHMARNKASGEVIEVKYNEDTRLFDTSRNTYLIDNDWDVEPIDCEEKKEGKPKTIVYTKKMLDIQSAINSVASSCHHQSLKSDWWKGVDILDDREVAVKLLLIHSEISEAMEGHRKDLMDEHLPHRKMIEVELGDALIRLLDLAEAMELNIGGAVAEKLRYNDTREDHKPENRVKDGGKKY